MHEALTESAKSDFAPNVEAEHVAVRPDVPAETLSSGASHAGPRVERAEARQQRDASTAPATLTVNASEITDPKAFMAFLQRAGFSRTFAKRVTNRDAFKSAAEPEPQATHAESAQDLLREALAQLGT